jgi:hypothetical protein
MSEHRPTRSTMSIEKATVSTMWEIAAIVKVLEPLGRIIEMGQQSARKTTH